MGFLPYQVCNVLMFWYMKILLKKRVSSSLVVSHSTFLTRPALIIITLNICSFSFISIIQKSKINLSPLFVRGSSRKLKVFTIGPYGNLLKMYYFFTFFPSFLYFCPRDFFPFKYMTTIVKFIKWWNKKRLLPGLVQMLY